MSEEIQPCPFCGANDVILDEPINPDLYAVVCNECGTVGQEDEDGNVAVAAWNTRPLEDALKARIDALEAELSRQSELLRRWMIAFDTEIVVITDQEMTFEIGHEFGNLVAETKKEMFADVLADRALKGEVKG